LCVLRLMPAASTMSSRGQKRGVQGISDEQKKQGAERRKVGTHSKKRGRGGAKSAKHVTSAGGPAEENSHGPFRWGREKDVIVSQEGNASKSRGEYYRKGYKTGSVGGQISRKRLIENGGSAEASY